MGVVVDFGWKPTADENRFHAMVLVDGLWLRREYHELKVGDVYQAWHGYRPVDPYTGAPDDQVYCKVTGGPRRVKGHTGWGVEIETGTLPEMTGRPAAANNPNPGTV